VQPVHRDEDVRRFERHRARPGHRERVLRAPRPTVTTLTGKGNRFSTSSNAIVSARVAIWPPPAILPREPVPGTGLVGAGAVGDARRTAYAVTS
jgi:hypothetical protein